MNTLLERLRKIPARFLEFWNKYSPMQRILMIAVGVGVFLAIILVSYFVTKPVMTTLVKSEKTADTAKIKDLLDENVSFDENEFIQINKRDETIDKYNDKQDEFFSKLISPNTLTPNNGTYLWVHPYYDEYFECVTIIRDGNALLYSANEDADDEQRKKAIKMIEELGFYKGGRNVTLPEKEITLEKNKAIEGNYMVTISDCE